MQTIPFNRPFVPERTFDHLRDVLSHRHFSGDGPYTKKCHALIETLLGVPKVLLTTSCTHALEMTALLLDLKPGDEVILPSFTFVSTVNAYVLRGAKPVFADIRPDTLNLDERHLASLIGPRTRLIVPVHYAGVGCNMLSILAQARHHGIPVVEDNAHGFFGRYQGKMLGTLGCMATLSFHETKNFSCGEGGALLISDPAHVDRAEILREKGTNRSRFFRGQVDKYSWVDVGSSYLPSDILAALLLAQLEARDAIQARRKAIWEHYADHLAEWAAEQGMRLPFVPDDCDQAYHMFYLLAPSLECRQALIAHLRSQGVSSVFHYLPLHLSDMGRKFGGREGDCPVTEAVSDQLLRLPFYFDLTEADQRRVVEGVRSFRWAGQPKHAEDRLEIVAQRKAA